jgi:uncharacterized membrane protein YuzA (DUF378 family)
MQFQSFARDRVLGIINLLFNLLAMKGKFGPAMIAMYLTIIGGINWGLVGVAMLVGDSNWNVVNLLLGSWPVVEAIVYVLVGVSAVWMLAMGCKECKK